MSAPVPAPGWDTVLPIGPVISVFTIIRSNAGIYRISPNKSDFEIHCCKFDWGEEFISCKASPTATYQLPNSKQ
jgi:hypothetical protein